MAARVLLNIGKMRRDFRYFEAYDVDMTIRFGNVSHSVCHS